MISRSDQIAKIFKFFSSEIKLCHTTIYTSYFSLLPFFLSKLHLQYGAQSHHSEIKNPHCTTHWANQTLLLFSFEFGTPLPTMVFPIVQDLTTSQLESFSAHHLPLKLLLRSRSSTQCCQQQALPPPLHPALPGSGRVHSFLTGPCQYLPSLSLSPNTP